MNFSTTLTLTDNFYAVSAPPTVFFSVVKIAVKEVSHPNYRAVEGYRKMFKRVLRAHSMSRIRVAGGTT